MVFPLYLQNFFWVIYLDFRLFAYILDLFLHVIYFVPYTP